MGSTGEAIKLGLVFAFLLGGVGAVGTTGVCMFTDYTCTENGSIIETTTTTTSTIPDNTRSPAATVETRTGTAEPATQTTKPIIGKEAPSYPDRTNKQWDRDLRFEGDPGETVADGGNWNASSEDVERFVAAKVNKYRVENGLEPLEYSHALASVSRAHSRDMADQNYFEHKNPDGERAWDRWGSGHCRDAYSENLFKSYAGTLVEGEEEPLRTAEGLAQKTLEGWQNSPPHDEAMKFSDIDAVGYGVYFEKLDGEDGYVMYVTMNMCGYNN